MKTFFKKLLIILTIFIIIVQQASPCFANEGSYKGDANDQEQADILVQLLIDEASGNYDNKNIRRLIVEVSKSDGGITETIGLGTTQRYLAVYGTRHGLGLLSSSQSTNILNDGGTSYNPSSNNSTYLQKDIQTLVGDSLLVAYYLSVNTSKSEDDRKSIMDRYIEKYQDGSVFAQISGVDITDSRYYNSKGTKGPYSIVFGLRDSKQINFKNEKANLEALTKELVAADEVCDFDEFCTYMSQKGILNFENPNWGAEYAQILNDEMQGNDHGWIDWDNFSLFGMDLNITQEQFEIAKRMKEKIQDDELFGFITGPIIKFVTTILDEIINVVQKNVLPYSPTAVALRKISGNEGLKQYLIDTYGNDIADFYIYKIKNLKNQIILSHLLLNFMTLGSANTYYTIISLGCQIFGIDFQNSNFTEQDAKDANIYYAKEYDFSIYPIPFIYLSPLAILGNEIPMLDIHFINSSNRIDDPFVKYKDLFLTTEYIHFTNEYDSNSEEYQKSMNERIEETEDVLDNTNTVKTGYYDGSSLHKDMARLAIYETLDQAYTFTEGEPFQYQSSTQIGNGLPNSKYFANVTPNKTQSLDTAVDKFNDYIEAIEYYQNEGYTIVGSNTSFTSASTATLYKINQDIISDRSENILKIKEIPDAKAQEQFVNEVNTELKELYDEKLSGYYIAPSVLANNKNGSVILGDSTVAYEKIDSQSYQNLKKSYEAFFKWYRNEYPKIKNDPDKKQEVQDSLDKKEEELQQAQARKNNLADALGPIIARWFVSLRNLGILLLLIVLAYLAIRLIISSTSKDKAKYKEVLISWITAMGLIFAMVIIISLVMTVYDILIEMVKGGQSAFISADGTVSYGDTIANKTRILLGYSIATKDYTSALGYLVLYGGMLALTIMLFVKYIIRAFMLMFLTVISPMVAITYPLDKYGDGKAQAFTAWFREFIATLFVQPFQLVLYKAIMDMALQSTVQQNIIFALLCLYMIYKSPELIKDLFSVKDPSMIPPDKDLAKMIQLAYITKAASLVPGIFGVKKRKTYDEMTEKEQEEVDKLVAQTKRNANLLYSDIPDEETAKYFRKEARNKAIDEMKNNQYDVNTTQAQLQSEYKRLFTKYYDEILNDPNYVDRVKKLNHRVYIRGINRSFRDHTFNIVKGGLATGIGSIVYAIDAIGDVARGGDLKGALSTSVLEYTFASNLVETGATYVQEAASFTALESERFKHLFDKKYEDLYGYASQSMVATPFTMAGSAVNARLSGMHGTPIGNSNNTNGPQVTGGNTANSNSTNTMGPGNTSNINNSTVINTQIDKKLLNQKTSNFVGKNLAKGNNAQNLEKLKNSFNFNQDELDNLLKSLNSLNRNSSLTHLVYAKKLMERDKFLTPNIAAYLSLHQNDLEKYKKELDKNLVDYEKLGKDVETVLTERDMEKERKANEQKAEILKEAAAEIVKNAKDKKKPSMIESASNSEKRQATTEIDKSRFFTLNDSTNIQNRQTTRNENNGQKGQKGKKEPNLNEIMQNEMTKHKEKDQKKKASQTQEKTGDNKTVKSKKPKKLNTSSKNKNRYNKKKK